MSIVLSVRRLVPALAVLLTMMGGTARADAPASTLDRIRQTGVIRMGYGSADVPFSYVGANGAVLGYSIELCKKLAEELRLTLNLPRLEMEFVEQTASNRVQLLNSGMTDIECDASTNTEERRRSAAFAASHYFATTRYVSLAKNHLSTLDDLKGRSVSASRGTVNVSQISQVNRDRKLNLSIVPVNSNQAAFDMVTQERVSAFAMDDVLLRVMIALSGNSAAYSLSEEPLTGQEPYGFMMRLGDREFATVVNAALRRIYQSPEMPAIYDRWFNQPIPEKNINLQLPMSEELKQALAAR